MAILAHPDAVYLGLDVHKDSISAGILNPGGDSADVEKIFNDEESVRRLVGRLGDPRLVWACYEAGPTGYDLHRLLLSLGVRCQVIAPSMIPKAPGDKSRPTSGTVGVWLGCIGPGSWWPSGFPLCWRRRYGICAGPGETWWRT